MRKQTIVRTLLRSLIGGLALTCVAAPGFAQRYSFREYSQGLGNLNIVCLVQDHTGYLWVGTQNGLYRYDGAQFQSFGPSQGLPERMIQNLYVGLDGTLWVATTNGIYFEQRDGRFAEVRPPAHVSQLLQNPGTVFAALHPDQVVTITRDQAYLLQRGNTEQWTAAPMHLEGSLLWSVLYTPDGALWYGCDEDLCRLANGKITHLAAEINLPKEKWTAMLLKRDGHLWIRGALHVGEIDPWTLHYTPHDVPGSTAPEAYPALAEDTQGRVLTAMESSIGLWENGQWKMVTERNGLSRFEVQDIYVDREGSVWVSEVGHGLKRWVGQDRWEAFTAADGLSDDLVWSAIRDREGRLWVGTESGLNWIPKGEETPKVWRQAGIMASRVGSLAQSSDGAIWVGSAAGMLVRIDPGSLTGKEWKLPEVYRVTADADGHVWVATNNGLFEMNAKGTSAAPELVETPVFGNIHQRFSDLCLDSSGRLWVAADQGLFLLDEIGWHRIDTGSAKATPDTIAVDRVGYLWAGGVSQDLMRLRVSGYRVVESKQIGRPPLMSEQVVSLMVDHRGWVWVGQDAGLSVFDGSHWRNYTQDDGLIWNDTDSFALAEDNDGSVWVGTSGGLSHLITPQNAPVGSPQPPAFSQVTYGNSVLGNGGSVEWGSNVLDISTALLSFKSTQDAGIRYRLLGAGQGTDWETSRDMDVHYRHLAPGNYRFEVAEADQAGRPLSPVAGFSFTVLPRWWQRKGLQIGLAVLFLAAIVLVWRKRVGLLLKQKRQLEDAVKTRTFALEREKGELMRTREQMRHYAEHDDLTGLWNHRIIVERLRIEVDRSRREGLPLSIILADLDHFKKINDTCGHPAGDQALREASATLQRMVRTYDWVGRYGGEEFLLVLPGSSFIHARQRAEELRTAIQSTTVQDGATTISITASFGVASGYPACHEDLIRMADAALYRAKSNGRNCVVATEIDARELVSRAG